MSQTKVDTVIVGGGFYGTYLALHLSKKGNEIAIVEKESKLLTKASSINQLRIHKGYHYPRSFTTAIRSRINYSRFVMEFKQSIYKRFKHYYAVALINSYINSYQFKKFSQKIGAEIKPAPLHIKSLFNPRLIEDVFEVEESVFNPHTLRKLILNKIQKYPHISILYNSEVLKVQKGKTPYLEVILRNGKVIKSQNVYNCTYSNANLLLEKSGIRKLPLRLEQAEVAIIKTPKELENVGITVMDGPFFSLLPYPPLPGKSTLTHVRYTPQPVRDKIRLVSQAAFMLKDVKRYLPDLGDLEYKKSLFEIKAILPGRETDDGRPIMFKRNYGFQNFYTIIGGKIDNIYDVIAKI